MACYLSNKLVSLALLRLRIVLCILVWILGNVRAAFIGETELIVLLVLGHLALAQEAVDRTDLVLAKIAAAQVTLHSFHSGNSFNYV